MPASLASRHGHSEVTVRSERHEEAFVAGLKSFVNEARMLAQFDHPALVKVHRFWEANSTAYMVMPYYEGTTLKDALRQMPAPPSEALLLNLLGPLVDALGALHARSAFIAISRRTTSSFSRTAAARCCWISARPARSSAT